MGNERTWYDWFKGTAPGKLYDWAVYGEDTPRVPYVDPQTGRAVTNAKPNPQTGRVMTKSKDFTALEVFNNLKNNWGIIKSAEALRGIVRGFGAIPQMVDLVSSVDRSFDVAKGMTPNEYYNKYVKSSHGMGYAVSSQGTAMVPAAPRPTDAQLRQMMQQDLMTANGVANMFSYRTPKGDWKFDTNRMVRSVSQDPTGVVAAILTAGRSGAAGLAGKLGRTADVAQAGSRAAKFARAGQKILTGVEKGLKVGATVANPVIPLTAAAVTSGPVRDVVTVAKNAMTGRYSIYRPDFLRAWEPFKTQVEARLRANGVADDVIASPEVQQRVFDMFNRQTKNKFADPFTAKAKKDFADNGMDPSDYASPHLGRVVENTINEKRGVTPAVMREAKLRAAGAASVTRSSATGEAPGFFFRNQEGPARATTEAQMSDALSGRFAPPPGTSAPTHRDLADDFIDTQVARRNAFGQSYDEAARNDGIYRDPNAFLAELDRQTESFLRQRGIDPSELTTNPEAFKNANAAIGSSRTNISNHGASVPRVEQTIGGNRYSYDRQFNVWIDDAGNPAPAAFQRALNADPATAAQIAATPPAPVNRLSLQNLEVERRSLNAAAQKAYEDGIKSGDFRNYNAITARIDALDDTAIKMGSTDFTGDFNKAIPALQQARAQYRDWRDSGIGSQNPVVSTAAQQVMSRTSFDPATGRYTFNDSPGSRNVVSQTFEGKLVGDTTAAPSATIGSGASATNPAETFAALSKTLSPDGQNTLANLVRSEGYGRPGATADDLSRLDAAYSGQGIDLLTPEQKRFLRLNVEARPDVSPSNIPQRDPFKFNPFATPEGKSGSGLIDRASQIVSPFVKGGLGYAVGTTIGGPGLGYALTGVGGFEGPIMQNLRNLRSVRAEQYGAPNFRVDIPNPQVPLSVGAAYGSQYAQGQGEQRQNDQINAFFNPPPKSEQTPKIPSPEEIAKNYSDFFGPPKEEDKIYAPPQKQEDDQIFAQPQAAGGRAGYKAGGKVGGIEPLVQALMAKAKMAKKASNKATEPLLNERDDAIANALAVAQKAI
jgi:hypothetical protein